MPTSFFVVHGIYRFMGDPARLNRQQQKTVVRHDGIEWLRLSIAKSRPTFDGLPVCGTKTSCKIENIPHSCLIWSEQLLQSVASQTKTPPLRLRSGYTFIFAQSIGSTSFGICGRSLLTLRNRAVGPLEVPGNIRNSNSPFPPNKREITIPLL